jgi:hypothetical protein
MFDEVMLDDLDDGMGQLHGMLCAGRRQLLSMLAAFDRREGWRDAGQTGPESYLVARLGVSRSMAARMVRLARRLEELPHLATAYEQGLLSDEAVEAVAAFATPETDREVTSDAVGRSVAELQLLARQARRVSTEEAKERHRRRYLAFRSDAETGTMRITGQLPDADGERVKQAVERLARQLDDPDPESGTRLPFDSRCADALVVLAGTRIARDQNPDLATIVVHIDADGAELADGTPLADETALRLCCDARVQAMLHGRDNRLLAVSVVEQQIPPALRRAVRRRDRHCRWPGCDRTWFAQIHHLRHHAKGGPTVDWNLALLCPFHHHLAHEGGWTVEGDATQVLTFRSPLGKELATGPPGVRPAVRARCERLFPAAQPAGV